MSQPRLNYLLFLHVHQEVTDKLDLKATAKDWLLKNTIGKSASPFKNRQHRHCSKHPSGLGRDNVSSSAEKTLKHGVVDISGSCTTSRRVIDVCFRRAIIKDILGLVDDMHVKR